jgi:hypothetical protein
MAPNGEIGATVASIIEALVAVAADKLLRLLLAFEVAHAVRGDNLVEQTKMVRDSACRPFVGCRRQHDPAAGTLLLAEKCKKGLVVRQQFRRQWREGGHALLACRAAHGQQARQPAYPVATQEKSSCTLDQRVGAQQRSVQINAERLARALLRGGYIHFGETSSQIRSAIIMRANSLHLARRERTTRGSEPYHLKVFLPSPRAIE